MNNVNLVGRLTRSPTVFLTESGKKGAIITLAIGRTFKNQNGEYEADYIDCTLWSGIAETTAEYCDKGDIVGVRGRLQTKLIEQEDGTKYKRMDIIANTVSFISTAKSSGDNPIEQNYNEVEKEELLEEVKVVDSKPKKNKKN